MKELNIQDEQSVSKGGPERYPSKSSDSFESLSMREMPLGSSAGVSNPIYIFYTPENNAQRGSDLPVTESEKDKFD